MAVNYSEITFNTGYSIIDWSYPEPRVINEGSSGMAGLIKTSAEEWDVPAVADEGFVIQYGVRIRCDLTKSCHHDNDDRNGSVRMFASKEARDSFRDHNSHHAYDNLYRAVELPEWRVE